MRKTAILLALACAFARADYGPGTTDSDLLRSGTPVVTNAWLAVSNETAGLVRSMAGDKITDGTNMIDAARNVYLVRDNCWIRNDGLVLVPDSELTDTWVSITNTTYGEVSLYNIGSMWEEFETAISTFLFRDGATLTNDDGVVVYRAGEYNSIVGRLALTNDIPAAPDFTTGNDQLVQTIRSTAPAPGNYSAVSNAAMNARSMTDLGVRGAPQGEGSWFTVNGQILAWNAEARVWGDENQVIDHYGEHYFFYGEGEADVYLDENFSCSINFGTNTYVIIGYTNTLAQVSQIPDVSGYTTRQQATNAAIAVADAKISTNNEAFVSAVLAVPIAGADAGDLAEIAEYGGYGTVGAAVLALIAGLAALKRRVGTAETALAQKASLTDLPYALVEPGAWEFSGLHEDATDASMSYYYYDGDGYWTLYINYDGETDSTTAQGSENDLVVVFSDYGITATRASLPGHLLDRAVNKVVPTVTATEEWIWSNGETGTPVFSNGYWTVQNASFDTYDGPVAGSSTDTEITFSKTDTKSFYFSYTDYDFDTGEQVFVFNVGGEGGEEVRAKSKWSDEYSENIVESIEYDGVKYVLEYPATEYSTGNTYSGIGTVAEHVVSLVTTYGPTITLTMPQAVPGRVRDLIARIDLSQAAGAPPVAFSGGSFEAVDGEMPELVKGVNLLSFTETAAGVIAVAYKEVKPIAQGGS